MIYTIAATGQAYSGNGKSVRSAELRSEITQFLDAEFAAHLGNIRSYDPPPGKVFGLGQPANTHGAPSYAPLARTRS